MKYCIVRMKKKEETAGNKAPDDIANICKTNEFKLIRWKQFPVGKSNIYKKLWLFLFGNMQWMKLAIITKSGDIILYQHPSYGYKLGMFWTGILKKKDVKTIALIHDLESLRKGIIGISGIGYDTKRSDLADGAFLKKFDIIIDHNAQMHNYFINNGFEDKKIVDLDIFDYLADELQEMPDRIYDHSLVIAGNLSRGKSEYIYKLCESKIDIKLHLYGINYQNDLQKGNIIYHGSYNPAVLPEKLEGNFGLVWDGDEISTCAGSQGEYLKYNNPHKTSLYLTAGIPVVVWDKAAIAEFVKNNNVGVTVGSLTEIEDILKNIPLNEYEQMVNNARIVGKKLKEGYFTSRALNEAISRI